MIALCCDANLRVSLLPNTQRRRCGGLQQEAKFFFCQMFFDFFFFICTSHNCVSPLANVSWDRIKQADRVYRDKFTDGGERTYTHTHAHVHAYTHNTTPHALSLTHIFSLTSTHLTCRRKSPVAYSFWLWFIFCALMPSPAVCLCVPGESRHSCCSDLITSGSN